ncbi:hypothetical protein GCM10010503_20000 [Streptomyces lucensis JCM 4490]|uniref:Uncharacterized protein n=1 Tax=Streptomyces lucensis JCM 4490 TaxID=1306176 RepID=A0A918J278_9ACTN|nr:hypothetical protein [Streptomyces lucensis]GGW43385.1 hypothetical protein GCM10010503_20000 [Streptomyces lucensis JCM 4490]
MSGSPKYSSVRVGALYAQREAAERRRREEERRARERRRAAERARLARQAAERRERARAEAERRRAQVARREAELQAGRAAERDARTVSARAEQARADERGLDEVRELIAEAQRSGAGAGIGSLERRLGELRERAARGERLGDAVEELRGRVVGLHREGTGNRTEDSATVLAGLERRFSATGPDGAALDADGHRRCSDLLDQLRAAAGPGGEVRFEALLGTVEHTLVRHAATVAGEREAAERRVLAEQERQAAEAAELEAAEAAELEAAEAARAALEQDLAEAAERLDVVRPAAEGVRDTAADLGDPVLADEIGDALRAVTEALAARTATEALRTVAELEDRLPDAERRLDELELAYQRRRDLVEALQDAMTGEGFAFEGGEDQGGSFRLHFTRPAGATYETTVGTGDDGAPVLVYHVQGEPDVILSDPRDEAVCDTTEALLERVHEALGGDDGFVPGELTWDGKPPGRRAEPLPRETSWRWTAP